MVVFSVIVLVLIGALAILDAERAAPDANIASFGDALWWALTTITTVGYGDRFPVTGIGRAVAAALMLVGISLLGIITATVAAWFARPANAAEPEHSVVSRLAALHELKRRGLITDDEHQRHRAALLTALGRP